VEALLYRRRSRDRFGLLKLLSLRVECVDDVATVRDLYAGVV